MARLKVQSGGSYGDPILNLDSEEIHFLAEDGRIMFEVRVESDHSITVRGYSPCKVNGKMYSDQFSISPCGSNSVVIKASLYDE